MKRSTTGPDTISEKLREALDGLRKDVTRVEIWAAALSGFSRPVPDYRPSPKFQLGAASGRDANAGGATAKDSRDKRRKPLR